jgi:hypothetical protein
VKSISRMDILAIPMDSIKQFAFVLPAARFSVAQKKARDCGLFSAGQLLGEFAATSCQQTD